MTKVYTLKSGNTFTAPSLFVNPQNPLDAKALWKADSENALNHIDGILVNMINYHDVYGDLALNTAPIFRSEHRSLREKVRIIDPSYHILLTGTMEEKAKMIATGFFDRRVEKGLKEIANSGLSPMDKSRKIVNDIYPYLHVKPAIEFQIRNNTDVIVSPCVNLSSQKRLTEQVNKAREMLMDTRTLLDTTFKSYKETRDLMNIITIKKELLRESNFATLFKLFLCNEPDQIGIRVMGIQESDTISMNLLFKFLREFNLYMKLREKQDLVPVHLLNVDEIGYVAYCNGVCNMVSPIASNPYYKFLGKNVTSDEERDMSGRYYDPYNMNYPNMSMLDKLPCACVDCRKYEYAGKISDEHRPTFRRMHWLRVKDDEIRQFRETQVRLDTALRDKFGYSMRTQLVAYIPTAPLFTIYE